MKRAQFQDDSGKWHDMPMLDFKLTPETVAFEGAKQQGLTTRVVEDKDGKLVVLNIYRKQKRRIK